MPIQTAEEIVENIFQYTPHGEKIDIGFFGGEPLLEFELIKYIVKMIEEHPSYDNAEGVELGVVTNGTIFTDEIGQFILDHNMTFCLSCDGPQQIQDEYRRYADGRGSSADVEETIKQASKFLPFVLVNAVYHPQNLSLLPQVIEYFSSLGITNIYLNADYSADWTKEDVAVLSDVYGKLAKQYIDFHIAGKPHFINLIDGKVALILKEGFSPTDRCNMGRGEFAFTPSGNIYPCERLIGFDENNKHCIGHISEGLSKVRPCSPSAYITNTNTNNECRDCGLVDYCMNWCGCSNFFSSAKYDSVGPFLCASEKAAISTGFEVFKTLEARFGHRFLERFINNVSPDSCTGT